MMFVCAMPDSIIIGKNRVDFNMKKAVSFLLKQEKIIKLEEARVEFVHFYSLTSDISYENSINPDFLIKRISSIYETAEKELLKKYPSATITKKEINFSRNIVIFSFISKLNEYVIINSFIQNNKSNLLRAERILITDSFDKKVFFNYLGNEFSFEIIDSEINLDLLIRSIENKNGISVLNKLCSMRNSGKISF